MQVGIFLREKVFVKDLFKLFKALFKEPLVECSPVAQAKILEYKLFISLFVGDMDMVRKIKSEIEKISDTWKPELFEWKYGRVIDWRMNFFEKIENRDAFIAQISQNRSDGKISKLKSSHILF